MDKKTLAALKASIKKWERNAKSVAAAMQYAGLKNCPLCKIHNAGPDGCGDCPVENATGLSWCAATPFGDWHDARYIEPDEHLAMLMAQHEADFLKSLLP